MSAECYEDKDMTLSNEDGYVAPRTDLERQLSEIWQDVLNMERVGIQDNFFALGGNSLQIVKMVAYTESVIGISVTVRTLFEYSTLENFAGYIEGQGKQDVHIEVIEKRVASQSVPLSLIQQSYWFLYQLEERGTTYNIPIVFSVEGILDAQVLAKSFRTVVDRHESLRTRLVSTDDGVNQIVDTAEEWSLSVINSDADAVSDLVRAEVNRPFDLELEGAFRATLFCLGDSRYVLSLLSHHTMMDGWSTGVLLNEVAVLYAAFHSGKANPLPPLPIQYGDYTLWQHDHIKGDRYDEQCNYWREKLHGLNPLLNLPTDHVRPTVQSYRGGSVPVALPQDLSRQLSAYAQSQGATLFHVLLAAMAVLLSRYTRTSDIPLGTAIANRPQKELESLIGCFANTVVLRCDASGEQSFDAIVQGVRDTALEAFAHADVPFDSVVEAVKPERSLGVPPIFQVMFRLHNQDVGADAALDSVSFTPYTDVAKTTVELDLNVSLTETPDGIFGEFAYASDLFNPETIERFVRHYLQLLTEAMKDTSRAVAHLPLLLAEEQQQLAQWNDTDKDYCKTECIHALFEETVARLPEKLAYVCGDVSYSYRELNAQANQLAHWLKGQGVGPEVCVGVSVGRSAWMGVSLLAVLKSGGTYVPLDPIYPQDRLGHMLEVVKPSFILTESQWLGGLPESDARVVCLDREGVLWADESIENPSHLPDAEHSVYILFTSGTTGKPKGILVAHKSLRNMAVAHAHWQLSDEDARILQFASFSFSISIWGSFMAWTAGATLFQVTDEQALPGDSLYQLLEDSKISIVTWPVSLLSVLPINKIPDSLRTVISSAEPCNDDVVARWVEKGCRFLNMYGNSEVSLGSTIYEYQQSSDRLTIGRAFPNTQMYLLDEQLQAVPPGVIAEIYTGGVGLAKEYVNQPEETAEKFIPNPFSDDDEARLYKTGDLGRYLANGEIEFIGREDFQVNIRGFRIELVEVEDVLRSNPGLLDVAVVARPDTQGIDQLVCFYVVKSSIDFSEAKLRQHVSEQLPNYMVPSVFVVLDRMPLTPNRKVDRLSLPTPDMSKLRQEGNYVAPNSDIECLLAEIWQKVLGVERIGLHDNFFALGGHSLLAVRIIEEINEELGINLPIIKLFQEPTIRQLSIIGEDRYFDVTKFECLRLIAAGKDSSSPVFLMPGIGGSILNLFTLGSLISKIGPVYGLQAKGLETGEEIHSSIEAIALQNVKEICKVQLGGRYRLVGHSFGGAVAYEMARILTGKGCQVDIIFLDSPSPKYLGYIMGLSDGEDRVNFLIDQMFISSTAGPSVNRSISGSFEEKLREIAQLQSRIKYTPPLRLSSRKVLFVKASDSEGITLSNDQCDWSGRFEMGLLYKYISSDHFGMLSGGGVHELSEIICDHFEI